MLYKLAAQAVTHLRSYLSGEEEVLNVLQFHQRTLANLIHAQMEQQHHEAATEYVVTVTRGFIHLEGADFTLPAGETIKDFRVAPEAARDIGGLLFGKFAKCTYLAQRFNSTPEWRFASILEADPDVLKWVKPAPGRFQIFYRGEHPYEPDFVVETKWEKLLCEVKAARDMEDAEVRDKSRAAVEWCRQATDHERQHDGKSWRYLLIPHDAVEASRTLAGLAAQFAVVAQILRPSSLRRVAGAHRSQKSSPSCLFQRRSGQRESHPC